MFMLCAHLLLVLNADPMSIAQCRVDARLMVSVSAETGDDVQYQ